MASGAIRAAFDGRATLAPEAVEVLIKQALQPVRPGSNLTARERQILELLCQGKSNRVIAGELYISRSTVDFHVSNILSKLNVTSRTQAVTLALRHGLVEHPTHT